MDNELVPSSFDRKKQILLFGAVIGLAFIVSLVLVLLSNRRSTQSENTALPSSKPTTTSSSQNSTSPRSSTTINPIIHQDEAKALNKTTNVPPSPSYHFQYKLAPNLLNQKRTFLQPETVLADVPCSLDSIPTTLPLYKLKEHLLVKDGQDIATKFKLSTTIYSLPTEGGIMQYYFTDKDSGDSLTIMEPSGSLTFHHPPKTIGASVDSTAAASFSLNTIDKFLHNQNLSFVSTVENPANETAAYVFKYRQLLASLHIIDGSSVGSLATKSPCDMTPAESVGTAEIWLARDGVPVNIFARIRSILESKTVPVLDLASALKQSEEKTFVDPVVFSAKKVTSGLVTLDEAAPPVYVDPGPQFGLSCYIPFYQACGKTAAGDKVCPLFPAVSIATIESYCTSQNANGGIKGEVGAITSKQGSTIKYANLPFTPPTPPPPPVVAQCSGGLVDYNIVCRQKGASDQSLTPACATTLGVPTNQSPHTDSVCNSGCKNDGIIGDVHVIPAPGEQLGDACKQIIEEYNTGKPDNKKIPLDKYLQQGTTPAGDYSCSVNICPC